MHKHQETPSRILRRVDAAMDDELPSIPPPSFLSDSGEHLSPDESSIMPTFQESIASSGQPMRNRSHSTPLHSAPPQLFGSRSTRSTASQERFAASLHNSKLSEGSNRGRSEFEPSFEVSKIEHAPHHLSGLSALVVDNQINHETLSLGMPALSEDDEHMSPRSGSLESVSLSSSSRSKKNEDPNPPESPSRISNQELFNVTRRRPMPRLREDFLNTPGSLSSSSLKSSHSKASPSAPSRSFISPPRLPSATPALPSAILQVVALPEGGDKELIETQSRPGLGRPPFSAALYSPLSRVQSSPKGLTSIREESRSMSDPGEDLKTPVPGRFLIQQRPTAQYSASAKFQDEDEDDENEQTSVEHPPQDPQSFGATPAESPPTRVLQGRMFPPPRSAIINHSSPQSTHSSDHSQDITQEHENLSPHHAPPQNQLAVQTATPHHFTTPRVLSSLRTPAALNLPTRTPRMLHTGAFLQSIQQSTRPRFAAHTPHRRLRGIRGPRLSHPLFQTHTPDSDSDHAAVGDGSFISTTSSHDLAVNERANASFDPTTDTNAPFNQVRLNAYLRGLNKQLMQENEVLNRRLEKLEVGAAEGSSLGIASSTSRSVCGAGQVTESAAAVVASHALLDDLATALQSELEIVRADRDNLQAEAHEVASELDSLRRRHEERAGDIQRLQLELEQAQSEARDRATRNSQTIRELKEGTEAVVAEMQTQLEDALAQVTTLQGRLALQKEGGSDASERVKMAEEQTDSMRKVKLAVEQANLKLERELRDSKADRSMLEDALHRSEEALESLQQRFDQEQARAKTELSEAMSAATSSQNEIREQFKMQLAEIQNQLCERAERLAVLEEELAASEDRLIDARSQVKQSDIALEESEKKMSLDAEEMQVMSKKIDALIRDRDVAESQAPGSNNLQGHSPYMPRKVSGASTITSEQSSSTAASSITPCSIPIQEHERIVNDLEEQLDEAEREIGRLELASKDSASAQAIAKARTTQINVMEKENASLHDQIAILKHSLQPFATAPPNGTPIRNNGSKSGTPQTLKKLNLLEKVLRTPGGPMAADYTMFRNTTGDGSQNLSLYLARFSELRAELALADDQYDQAMDDLGNAGFTNVKLMELLADSREKVRDLEKEVADIQHSEERVHKRLQRCKCTKCGRRFDASAFIALGSDTSTSLNDSLDVSVDNPSQSREALRTALQKATAELAGLKKLWTSERQNLVGEKAILQDKANRLSAEVKAEAVKVEQERKKAMEAARRIQDEAERQKSLIQIELKKAKESISALDDDLRQERLKLQRLASEREKAVREKNALMSSLADAQNDLEEVKIGLNRIRHENENLENELEHTSSADQRARKLEAKISQNRSLIDQLRQERDALIADQAELQARYNKATEQTEAIRQQFARSRSDHSERRHDLDLRVAEIERLRLTLEEQYAELRNRDDERRILTSQQAEVVQTVVALETDLKRVRQEAETIRKDVLQLKEERAQLQARNNEDRVMADKHQTKLHLLHEQVASLQKKCRKHEEFATTHVCAADEKALRDLQSLHREHCQSFMRRIHYLKARVTREAGFRDDLIYQKQHLLRTIGCFEKTEKNLMITMARLSIPKPPPPRRQKVNSLRSAALAVVFLVRARNASMEWNGMQGEQDAIVAGYELARGHPLLIA